MNNDFLRIMRKAFNKKAVTQQEWEEIESARCKILNEIEELIPKNPEIALKHIEMNLLAIEEEAEFTEWILKRLYDEALDQGNDKYCYLIREFMTSIEDLMFELLEKMKGYWPEKFVLLRKDLMNKWAPSLKIPVKGSSSSLMKLSNEEVALILFYTKRQIEKGKPETDEIAQKYGFKNGTKLYINYCKYLHTSQRINPEYSAAKTKNKIQRLENVCSYLEQNNENEALTKASEELEVLRSKFNEENK